MEHLRTSWGVLDEPNRCSDPSTPNGDSDDIIDHHPHSLYLINNFYKKARDPLTWVNLFNILEY